MGVPREVQKLQNLFSLGASGFLFLAHLGGEKPAVPNPLAPLVAGDEHEVFQDGHGFELPGDLKGPDQPKASDAMGREMIDALAVKPDLSLVGPEKAADDVEKRGLACSVGADQPGDRGPLHFKGASVDRADTAKLFGHLSNRKHVGSLLG